jgi:hypothetical protein
MQSHEHHYGGSSPELEPRGSAAQGTGELVLYNLGELLGRGYAPEDLFSEGLFLDPADKVLYDDVVYVRL